MSAARNGRDAGKVLRTLRNGSPVKESPYRKYLKPHVDNGLHSMNRGLNSRGVGSHSAYRVPTSSRGTGGGGDPILYSEDLYYR